MAIYHTATSSSKDATLTGVDLLLYNKSAKSNPTILRSAEAPIFLAKEIGKSLCGLLLTPAKDVNISMSLSDLGLDSLVGVN